VRGRENTSRPLARTMRKEKTKAEAVLWGRLRALNRRGWKFRQQHPIGPFVADFAHVRGRLVIEIDDTTHSTDEERAYDRRREDYINSEGWDIFRVSNDDVYRDVASVVDQITGRLPLT
jgi:very-short-patch-repair endonuclease